MAEAAKPETDDDRVQAALDAENARLCTCGHRYGQHAPRGGVCNVVFIGCDSSGCECWAFTTPEEAESHGWEAAS